MNYLKEKTKKIYNMSASLNLYVSICRDLKKERVITELKDIEHEIQNLLEEIQKGHINF